MAKRSWVAKQLSDLSKNFVLFYFLWFAFSVMYGMGVDFLLSFEDVSMDKGFVDSITSRHGRALDVGTVSLVFFATPFAICTVKLFSPNSRLLLKAFILLVLGMGCMFQAWMFEQVQLGAWVYPASIYLVLAPCFFLYRGHGYYKGNGRNLLVYFFTVFAPIAWFLILAVTFSAGAFLEVLIFSRHPADLEQALLSYFFPIFVFTACLICAPKGQRLFQRIFGEKWWFAIRTPLQKSNRGGPLGTTPYKSTLEISGEPQAYWMRELEYEDAKTVLKLFYKHLIKGREKEPNPFTMGFLPAIALWENGIEDCPRDVKPQVEKWYRHLQANPPTPQDWKDSGFDFSDKDNLHGTSPPGAPVAISAIVEETEDNTP